jgi:hypothetical protein
MNYVLQDHNGKIRDITVEDFGGNMPKIKQIIPSEDKGGIGVIHTDNSNSTPLNISEENIGLNQKIFVSGFSDSRKSMFHYSGEVVGVMENHFEIKANVRYYRELAGSPVFNNQGQLIGIVYTYNKNSQTFGVVSIPLIKDKINVIVRTIANKA